MWYITSPLFKSAPTVLDALRGFLFALKIQHQTLKNQHQRKAAEYLRTQRPKTLNKNREPPPGRACTLRRLYYTPTPACQHENSIQPPCAQNLIAKKNHTNISFFLTINALHVNISPALTAPPKNMLKLYSFAYWETMTRLAELLIVILFS